MLWNPMSWPGPRVDGWTAWPPWSGCVPAAVLVRSACGFGGKADRMLFQCHDQTAQAPSGRPSPRLGTGGNFDMSQVSKWLFDALGEIGEQEVPVLRRGPDRLCQRPGEYPKIVRYPAVRPAQ